MTNGLEGLLLHIRTIAGNILAMLPTNDGTTSLHIKDSDMNTVVEIDSDGNTTLAAAAELRLRDTALLVYSSADGQLDIDADVEVEITAPTLDIDAATAVTVDTTTMTVTATLALTGNMTVTGTVDTVDLQNHSAQHDPGGGDALTTAAAGAIEPDDSAAEGSATSFARSDHTHAIVGATAGTITPDASAAEGSATSFARSDHAHAIAAAAPAADSVDVGSSAEGSSSSFARADHTHNLDESITPTWTGIHVYATTAAGSWAIQVHTTGSYGLEVHVDTTDQTAFNVRSHTTNALLKVAGDGTVTMVSLAGSGSRAVVADANGVLSAP